MITSVGRRSMPLVTMRRDASSVDNFDEDESDEDEPVSLFEKVWDVLACTELLVTGCSSAIHFALILLLAFLHIQSPKHQLPPVLTASVEQRDPPPPELKVMSELEHPTAAAGPQARRITTPSATVPAPINVGVEHVAMTLPSLNDMVLHDAVRAGGAGGLDQVSFFGATCPAKRVVFVVDNSRSMRGKKFEKCKEELLTAVSNLSPRQQFYVVFFSDTEHPMLEPNAPLDLVHLDTKMWLRFEKWVNELELQLGTRARTSLERTFKMKPDVVFLLTDGQFTDRAEEYLLNLGEMKVTINTIGFYANTAGAKALRSIAQRFHGEYSDIR